MDNDRSMHSKYSFKRLPRQKRTLPLYGERDDRGKFYRCWNCGFICNVEKHRLSGAGHLANTVIPTAFTDEDDETLYYPDVVSACPFCGAQYK